MRPLHGFFSASALTLGLLLSWTLAPAQATTRALPEFTALVAENGPTVVNISTKQAVNQSQELQGSPARSPKMINRPDHWALDSLSPQTAMC
ncbi:MAG: hypothetical protein H6R22_1489 [Chromatiaceae bacterium]|nr:hypothetical protein [Chromatiaceae bacterium]